jgi:Fe-S-cluster containining protein
MEIPVTLLDIRRISEFQGKPDRDVFNDIVQDGISSLTALFKMKKVDATGLCIFLSAENVCGIHNVKPNICRFYSCGLGVGQGVMSWTATCRQPEQRAALWEQSVAVMLTKAYLEKNGMAWNETDFRAALASIYDNIPVRDSQKLKLGRDGQGRTLAILYDCSRCDKRGKRATETPLTLDDVRRISAHLGMHAKLFFAEFVSPEPSAATGGLKLKRGERCIFFKPGSHCSVENVRPLHCRFTPCPKRTSSDEMITALFLGSGTLEEQYRHQVALALTRKYVSECGSGYRGENYRKVLSEIDRPKDAIFNFESFCRQIARYRYVDDTCNTGHGPPAGCP